MRWRMLFNWASPSLSFTTRQKSATISSAECLRSLLPIFASWIFARPCASSIMSRTFSSKSHTGRPSARAHSSSNSWVTIDEYATPGGSAVMPCSSDLSFILALATPPSGPAQTGPATDTTIRSPREWCSAPCAAVARHAAPRPRSSATPRCSGPVAAKAARSLEPPLHRTQTGPQGCGRRSRSPARQTWCR